MFMSHHQTTGQNNNANRTNKFLENVAKFKHFGTPVPKQNYIYK
jgi:hypothetical protein